MTAPATLRLLVTAAPADPRTPLPAGLAGSGSRGGDGAPDALLADVVATHSWSLSAPNRSDASQQPVDLAADTRLLALEAADGTTVFIRADALAERLAELARSRPELRGADGSLDLAALTSRDAANRGTGEWIWRKVTALALGTTPFAGEARDKFAELTGSTVDDIDVAATSAAGARAIVWAIEERRPTPPGLYPWRGGALDKHARLADDDAALKQLADKPGLIFIHGTGSHTLGAFGELPASRSWTQLVDHFEGRLFGFEHHSFSESPIDNALALARVLPKGARIALVTHSRGGLVGDLLCLDAADEATLTPLIAAYRPRPQERLNNAPDPHTQAELDRFADQEQAKLAELVQLLRRKALRIERYVRVACPARGTALLSDNLDIFLSGLLALVRRFGSWAAAGVAAAHSGPRAAADARLATDKGLAVLTRIVLEIAARRVQPQLLPGIEAMLPDAPLGMLLASAPSRPGLAMALIAGDGEGGGLVKRLGALFTDWMFFDRADNDLVVDTASMYGGLADKPLSTSD